MERSVGERCGPKVPAAPALGMNDINFPAEPEIELAKQSVRVHCPIAWPEGLQCNNCQASFPCTVYRWGYGLLERAGWTDDQIMALDTRVGPWF